MKRTEPIGEIDLLAYADGLLEADVVRKEAVERYLSEDAEAAAYVAEIQAQNEEIREFYGPCLLQPVPERLTAALDPKPGGSSGRTLARAAAVAALVVSATAAGWLLGQQAPAGTWALNGFVERAATFHKAAVTEEATATEAGGKSVVQALGWLNQRIALELSAPDLATEGFDLVAKESVGPSDDPVMRLVYRRADGAAINLFLRPRWEESESGVGKVESEDVTVLYWLQGPLAFALTTDVGEAEADHLAQSVRTAIERARLNDGAPAMALSPTSSPAGQNTAGEEERSLMPLRPGVPGKEQASPPSQFN